MTADLLADRLNLHPGLRRDGGIAFNRRASQTNKMYARHQVERLFSRRAFPESLRILTMPSLNWTFERSLIQMREHGRGLRRPRCTHITSIERSPFIYQAAIPRMPGADVSLVGHLAPPPFARKAIRSFAIGRYFECDLEELALWYADQNSLGFDAAWIDLTGPLSFRTLETLKNLWASVSSVLVVTSLRARWALDFSAAIHDAGGLAGLLMDDLTESVVVSSLDYMDTSPMSQITLRRASRSF